MEYYKSCVRSMPEAREKVLSRDQHGGENARSEKNIQVDERGMDINQNPLK